MNFLKRPLPATGFKTQVIAGIALGSLIFLILAIFQPFGTYNVQSASKYLILAGYGVVISSFYILSHLFFKIATPRFYDMDNWTVGKELLAMVIIFFVITTATFFFRLLTVGGSFTLGSYSYSFGIALACAFMPLLLYAVVQFMRANNYEQQLAIANSEESLPPPPTTFHLSGNNKNEEFKLLKDELLFLKSSDNYVMLFLNKGGGIEKHMIRSTLSQLAKQLEDPDIFQVHRSFLVNLSQVKELGGKSPNYTLSFADYEELIPISRNRVQEIREKLGPKAL